jgi:hypothetical protein
MADLVPDGGDIPQLAERINAAHARAEAALRLTLANAREAGELLLQAREKVPHGAWLPWVQGTCRIPERAAQAYLRAGNQAADLPPGKATPKPLWISPAFPAAAGPVADRLAEVVALIWKAAELTRQALPEDGGPEVWAYVMQKAEECKAAAWACTIDALIGPDEVALPLPRTAAEDALTTRKSGATSCALDTPGGHP